METKELSYDIKLPSSTNAVTKLSLWNFLKSIAITGSIFTKDQLQSPPTESADAILRNLSYLKYLGVIKEIRTSNDSENVQKFEVVNNKIVKDLLYELKASREEVAKSHWRLLLENHDLYLALKSEFFKDDTQKTFIDLEHFLRGYLPNKSPNYYQTGGKFIIGLLAGVGLLMEKGNQINLVKKDMPQDEYIDADFKAIPINTESLKGTITTVPAITDENYMVIIKGPDVNHSVVINEEIDLEIVNKILEKVKQKLMK